MIREGRAGFFLFGALAGALAVALLHERPGATPSADAGCASAWVGDLDAGDDGPAADASGSDSQVEVLSSRRRAMCERALTKPAVSIDALSDEDIAGAVITPDPNSGLAKTRLVHPDGGREYRQVLDCTSRWHGSEDAPAHPNPEVLARSPLDGARMAAFVQLGQHDGYCLGPTGVLVVVEILGTTLRVLDMVSDDLMCLGALDAYVAASPFPDGHGIVTRAEYSKDGEGGERYDVLWTFDDQGLRRLGGLEGTGSERAGNTDLWIEHQSSVHYEPDRAVAHTVTHGPAGRTERTRVYVVDGGLVEVEAIP